MAELTLWKNRAVAGTATSSCSLSVTVGDLIVVFVSNTADDATASDGVNTYTKRRSQVSDRPSWQTILSAVAATTATLTITGGGTGVDATHAGAFYWDGGETIPGTVNTSSGAQSATSTNLTTTSSDTLVVAFGDASTANDPGTGFTAIAQTVNATRVTSEYQTALYNDAGTITAALANGSPARSIVAVAFDPPSVTITGGPTFFGVASAPADNSSQAGPGPVAVTPPASMLAGDLAVVYVQRRGTYADGSRAHVPEMFSTTNTQTAHGGQDWNAYQVFAQTSVAVRIFWCVFNGTWSADPSWQVDGAGTEPITVTMLVFRPTSSSKYWIVNKGPKYVNFVAGSTPFTKTISSITTVPRFGFNTHVAIAGWFTADANTWGTLSGTNWSQTSLGSQYRNASGSAQSAAFAYQLQGDSSYTNAVSLNQATLGGDAGTTAIIAFTEIDLPTGGTAGTGASVRSASNGSNTTASSVTATLAAAVTSGNTVIGMCYHETLNVSGEMPSLIEIRDDQGNRYYPLRCINRSGLSHTAWLFFKPNITNAPTQITAEFTHSCIANAVMVAEMNGAWKFWRSAGVEWEPQDPANPETVSAYPALTPPSDGCLAFLAMYASNTIAIGTDFWNPAGSFTEIAERIGTSEPAATALHSFVQGTAASLTGSAGEDLGKAASMFMGIFEAPAAASGGGPLSFGGALVHGALIRGGRLAA